VVNLSARIGRLRWRSRRGLLELDQCFEPFFGGDLSACDEAAVTALERLLDCEDIELLDWLLGRSRPQDPQLVHALALLRRV
jgi:succinate dehydrogenase flavin-adding protein (antitoxin of CptAB toxin-antitoxin module)